MTRSEIVSEIARLLAAAPSRFASFAQRRADRVTELESMLATLPEEEASTVDSPELVAWFANQRKAENRQRGMERRGY